MTEPTRREQREGIDIETPENDAAEQQRSADNESEYDEHRFDEPEEFRATGAEPSLEVDPADAAEQEQDAGVDEDDYR